MSSVTIDNILTRIGDLIQANSFEDLETETVEIKPVPSSGGEWTKIHESANAFLNTHGGIIILGIKEEQGPAGKRYVVTGWLRKPKAELRIFHGVSLTAAASRWNWPSVSRISSCGKSKAGALLWFTLMNFQRN